MSEYYGPEVEGFVSSVDSLDDIFRRRRKSHVQAVDEAWAAFETARDEQRKEWRSLSECQGEICREYGSIEARATDLLHLDVGGFTRLCYLRSTLTLVDGSRFSVMFSGRWDKRLPRDTQGRIFLDEDPYIFQMFMGYLESLEVPASHATHSFVLQTLVLAFFDQ